MAAIFGKPENANAILNHPKFDRADRKLRQTLLDKCLLGGSTSLRHRARPDLIEALLKRGANPNAKRNGVSSIQLVASNIHPDNEDENKHIKNMISILLKHRATLDLFSAVAIGDRVQVDLLLKQNPASANSRGPNGHPALHFAVKMKFEDLLRALLDSGGDVDIRRQSEEIEFGETALACAAFWGRYDMAKLLIEAGADVNALTSWKSTPLHSAARMTNVKIARLLLENGAKISAQDSDGETPLDWCRDLNWKHADEIEKLFREFQRKK